MANKEDIRRQLIADMQAIKGNSHWESMARATIDSAINAIDADNWDFACDRLSIAVAHLVEGIRRAAD